MAGVWAHSAAARPLLANNRTNNQITFNWLFEFPNDFTHLGRFFDQISNNHLRHTDIKKRIPIQMFSAEERVIGSYKYIYIYI